MTAQGKITAARLHPGDRILITRLTHNRLVPAPRLTGDDVITARVTAAPVSGAARLLSIATTEGELLTVPHQTFTLAPESPAAVKRAHAEALIMNDRFDRHAAIIAAGKARRPRPEVYPPGTPVLISSSSRGGIPLDLRPGVVVEVRAGVMHVRLDGADTNVLITQYIYCEATGPAPSAQTARRREQRAAARADGPAPLVWHMISGGHYVGEDMTGDEPVAVYEVRREPNGSHDNRWSLRRFGTTSPISTHRLLKSAQKRGTDLYAAEQQQAQPVALPTPAARPTPVEAIAAHYREHRLWPSASQVVRRGADLDELHAALARGEVERFEAFTRGAIAFRLPAPDAGRPLAVDDVVTVDPMRESWQYDVIAVDDIDGALVRVAPRNPIDVDDAPRWVSREYTHRVPAELVDPVEDGDQADTDTPPPTPRPARTVADMLLPAMPEQYRRYVGHLLAPFGFAPPTGGRVPADADADAFLLHEPTGLAVGTTDTAVRLSYPAQHAGEGDGDTGTAWLDLAYGTSFETVADVAIGLSQRLGSLAATDHTGTYVWPEGATPFDPGTGPIPGYVAGLCGHRVAASEWVAGFRVCERDAAAEARVDAYVSTMTGHPAGHHCPACAEARETGWSIERASAAPAAGPVLPAGVADYRQPLTEHERAAGVVDPWERDPYVGEGADGARRSAEIDRAEADTYPTGSADWQRCRESAARWDDQARAIEAAAPAPLADATGLGLVSRIDEPSGASVGMYRDVDAAPVEWGALLGDQAGERPSPEE